MLLSKIWKGFPVTCTGCGFVDQTFLDFVPLCSLGCNHVIILHFITTLNFAYYQLLYNLRYILVWDVVGSENSEMSLGWYWTCPAGGGTWHLALSRRWGYLAFKLVLGVGYLAFGLVLGVGVSITYWVCRGVGNKILPSTRWIISETALTESFLSCFTNSEVQ